LVSEKTIYLQVQKTTYFFEKPKICFSEKKNWALGFANKLICRRSPAESNNYVRNHMSTAIKLSAAQQCQQNHIKK
jgi:hypothetical protein